MADETTAVVSQPPTAGEEQQPESTTQQDYSSFLGPPSVEADLSEDERPAPGSEEEAEGEPELSQQPQPGEGEPEQEEEEAPEGQPEGEEEAEQPPSVEERLKDLTPRESEHYAQRYPNPWKMLHDPKTPEDVKHLLLDKIDGDHEIQRRIAAEQEFQTEEEPTLEAEQPAQAAPLDAATQRTAYYSQIDNLVQTRFDQQSVKEFGDAMLRMFNVNV
jgi:hypothetical protein